MNIISIIALCIVTTIICKLFDKTNKEYGLFISLFTIAIILFFAIKLISPITARIEELFVLANVSNEYFRIVLKAIGICYLTQLGCDYCKDSGENALASELEIVGKFSLLIISLPLFDNIVNIVKELLLT